MPLRGDSGVAVAIADADEFLAQSHLCKPCSAAITSAVRLYYNHLKPWYKRYMPSMWIERAINSRPGGFNSGYVCNPTLDRECYVCWRILKHRSLDPQAMAIDGQVEFSVNIRREHYANELVIRSPNFKDQLSFDIFSHSELCANETPCITGIAANTAWSASTIELAQNWMKMCISTHKTCQEGIPETHARILPARLILVESTGSAIKARLRETVTLPNDMRYLSLSHCWGTTPFMTLTSDNFNEFLDDIPLYHTNFNKLFREAFEVTTDLRYSYIWIDSLCIIQDSPGASDWADECPRIGHIYLNADCNISATGFANGKDGIFVNSNRNPRTYRPVSIKVPFSGSYYLIEQDQLSSQFPKSALIGRGWVLQEHYFSPRTLHFTEQGVVWTCREQSVSEIWRTKFPLMQAILFSGNDRRYGKRLVRDVLDPTQAKSAKPDLKDGSEGAEQKSLLESQHCESPASLSLDTSLRDIIHGWHKLVAVPYSKTKLTYASDKLPAISTLATIFQQKLATRYFAGHWESHLLESLCWSKYKKEEEESQMSQTEKHYVAPSWSWLSSNSKICNGFPQNPPHFISQVVSANFTPASSDTNGALKDGYIQLRGPRSKLNAFYDVFSAYIVIQWDDPNLTDFMSSWSSNSKHERPSVPQCDESLLVFLPLYIARDFPYACPPNECWPVIHGLILHQEEQGRAIFTRCGAFEVGNPFGFKFHDAVDSQEPQSDVVSRFKSDFDKLKVYFSQQPTEELKVI